MGKGRSDPSFPALFPFSKTQFGRSLVMCALNREAESSGVSGAFIA